MTSIPCKINWPLLLTKLSLPLLAICLVGFQAKITLANDSAGNMDDTMHAHGMPSFVNNEERFAPCPKRPNCVSSIFYQDKKHYVLPLSITPIGKKSRMDRLLEVINSFDRIKVTEVDKNYVKVEFTSKIFGFVDDVEFLVNDSHTDVRSASRIGYSDLGANRRRVEEIRERLKEQEIKAQKEAQDQQTLDSE